MCIVVFLLYVMIHVIFCKDMKCTILTLFIECKDMKTLKTSNNSEMPIHCKDMVCEY
jgi:hypothetical protein